MKSTNILDIFIITYNRAAHLDATLSQLVGCPFIEFSITILDNCSRDNTYDVFLKYNSLFPNLNYIKNKINIGADANVLRAAELSNGVYTWILCDDDHYDFSLCEDVLLELNKGEVDAIMVGWSENFIWPVNGMHDTPANLMKSKFPYFSVPTFVPGSIFKTELFHSQIKSSYENISNLLPIMTYYIQLYNNKSAIYVSKRKLVSAIATAGWQYTFLRVMVAVINTFYLINLPKVRRKAFYSSYLPSPNLSIINLALILQKSKGEITFTTWLRFFRLLHLKEKIIFLFAYLMAPIGNRILLSDAVIANVKKFKTKKQVI